MAKMTYCGVLNPRREFEAMRPSYVATLKMMRTCRPFGPDYDALAAVIQALDAAAEHFLPGENEAFFRAGR
jgi:hypothetical protein